jgi:curli biogenesis system outer membrane secretion channel CsgG
MLCDLRSCCIVALAALPAVTGCVTEHHRAIATRSLAVASIPYSGPKYRVVLGDFKNESTYMRGIFSDGKDRLGNQAKNILKNHLIQSGRFIVLERENLAALKRESEIGGEKQSLIAGEVLITGAVTEFGRREVGTKALGGLLGSSRTQSAYAKISASVVNVKTSQSIFATQGAGECSLSNSEFLGFGGTAGYDSTLNGKVLNVAVMETVKKLIANLSWDGWRGSKAP